ncbi:MAG: imidazoleglycerol-phosphate dehydratase HisB [Myxococcota bacterium]
MSRIAATKRTTRETSITVRVNLDGTGTRQVSTGVGFLDHMVETLARFSNVDIQLTCEGDLHIDAHHTVEDCALALGQAVAEALGEKRGIVRFGHAYAPLDEAMARAVIDLSGRPWPDINLHLTRDRLGTLDTDDLVHFLQSFAIAARASLHVDVLKGRFDHHKAEAAFKAVALALRHAIAHDGGDEVPSLKGTL